MTTVFVDIYLFKNKLHNLTTNFITIKTEVTQNFKGDSTKDGTAGGDDTRLFPKFA